MNFGQRLLILTFCAVMVVFAGNAFLRSEEAKAPLRLVSEEFDVWSCDWSADGRVAFSGKIKGEAATRMRIWLYRPEGDKPPILWTGTGSLIDLSPSWAPDGTGVVMVRRKVSDIPEEGLHSSLWWKAFPSGEGLRLTDGPWDRDPAWSPDSEFVVFVRGDGLYRSSLAVVGRNGGKVDVLVTMEDGFIAGPYWSRDQKIYFTRLKQDMKQVCISDESYNFVHLGQGSIFYYDLKTAKVHTLLDDGNDNRYPVLSPDGRFLAYVSNRGVLPEEKKPRDRGALYVLDLNTGRHYQVVERASLNGSPPRWSPDGKKLIYFSFRQDRPAMWVVEWEGPK